MQRPRSIGIATTVASLSLFDSVIVFCQRAEGCGASDAAKRRCLIVSRGFSMVVVLSGGDAWRERTECALATQKNDDFSYNNQ